MQARKGKFVLVKNAVVNIVRGGASALMALALPPFLSRHLSNEKFSAWSFAFQLTGNIAILDFGIQTTVGRFVAFEEELGNFHKRDCIVSTALALLICSATIAAFGVVTIASCLPLVFRTIPYYLQSETAVCIVVIGLSSAISLPAAVLLGIFVGRQRYEIPAAVIGISRLATTIGIVLIVRHSSNLIHLAVAVAGINLLTAVAQYLAYKILASEIKISLNNFRKEAAKEILQFCFSLSLWSAAMLFISGLDTSIVAVFEFKTVAAYSVALSMLSFVTGIQNSIFSVVIPAATVAHAKQEEDTLGGMLVTLTRYGMFSLLLTGLPLILAAKPLLKLWVGPAIAAQSAPLLQVLVIAQIIRLSATPYAVLLIGTGQQRLVRITPLIEAIVNFGSSIVLGRHYGAIGVALGTLVGSIAGIAGNFLYNMPRTSAIRFKLSDYIWFGLLRPVLCMLPALLLLVLFVRLWSGGLWAFLGVLLMGTTVTIWLIWNLGILESERQSLAGVFQLTNRFRK